MSGPVTKDATTWMLGLMQIRVGAFAANISNITGVLAAGNSIGALGKTTLRASAEFFKQMSGFPQKEDGVIALSETAALEITFKEATPYNLALARGLDPTASVAPLGFYSSKKTTIGTTDATMVIGVGAGAGWGVLDDQWTVVFASATTGKIYGKATGLVHTFANLTDAMAPVHDSTLKYFSLPADFFTGTWAADQIYTFYTVAGGSSAYASAHSGSIGLGGMTAPANIRVEGVYTFPNGTNTITIILPRAQAVATMEMDPAEASEAAIPVTLESKNASSDNTAGNAVWDTMPLGRMIWA